LSWMALAGARSLLGVYQNEISNLRNCHYPYSLSLEDKISRGFIGRRFHNLMGELTCRIVQQEKTKKSTMNCKPSGHRIVKASNSQSRMELETEGILNSDKILELPEIKFSFLNMKHHY
jgi:hypothetical protein